MSNQIILVVAADNKYTIPLTVTLYSVVANLKHNHFLLVYVLDGGIEENNKRRVERSLQGKKCHIEWVSMTHELLGWARPMKHLSIAAYFRLMMPKILPVELSKVIYLDCDLVVNHDLRELWDIDIGTNYVLAVQDSCTPYVSCLGALSRYAELGLSSTAKFFNSGVLVINLKRWREDCIPEKAIEYIDNYGDTLNYADQDVLNALFALNWGELDARWNQLVNNIGKSYQIDDAFIIHYSSSYKPWSYIGRADTDALFFKYLLQTDFTNQKSILHLNRWKNSVLKGLTAQIKQVVRL